MRLNSKRAVITGGASGIGRAMCQLFAEEGAKVVIADIDESGGRETLCIIHDSGGDALFVNTDVSSSQRVDKLITEAAQFMGGIDILVNDAAAFVFGKVEDVTSEDWEKVFGVNVIGRQTEVDPKIWTGG